MGFNENKFKVHLKLAVNRLKMLQSKKQSINQQQRRELANLLEAGKVESARIRVEHVIREDYNMEAMEVLELLCELLLARSALLAAQPQSAANMDPSLLEAVQTIIFASTRCEGAKELTQVRDQLIGKFGREFGEAAHHNRMGMVNVRVFQRLQITAPPAELVTSYLREIASAYNVQFNGDEGGGELLGHSPVAAINAAAAAAASVAATTTTAPPVATVTLAQPGVGQVIMINNQPYQLIPAGDNTPTAVPSAVVKQPVVSPINTSQQPPAIPALPGATASSPTVVVTPTVMDLPIAPASDLASPTSDSAPDFDALAKRFEDLKRKK